MAVLHETHVRPRIRQSSSITDHNTSRDRDSLVIATLEALGPQTRNETGAQTGHFRPVGEGSAYNIRALQDSQHSRTNS